MTNLLLFVFSSKLEMQSFDCEEDILYLDIYIWSNQECLFFLRVTALMVKHSLPTSYVWSPG